MEPFTGHGYRHPHKTSYTVEELAEDLKGEAMIVKDVSHVGLTQDGSVPTQHVDSEASANGHAVFQEEADLPQDAGQQTSTGHASDSAIKKAHESSEGAVQIDAAVHPEKYGETAQGEETQSEDNHNG